MRTIIITAILLLGTTSHAQNNNAQQTYQVLKMLHNDSVRNFNLKREQIERNHELKMQAPPRQQPTWQSNPFQDALRNQQY